MVAASQCTRGTVKLDAYEVGRLLLDLGVVSAGDMTTEACVTKMAHLFGRGFSTEKIRRLMMSDLRGEIGNARESSLGVGSGWSSLGSLSQIPGLIPDHG